MLKVAVVNDPTQNLIAPSVYIDSVEKENNNYTIHYSLVDNVNNTLGELQNKSWINNQEVLNSISVYVTDGLITEKRLLNASVAANAIKNNRIKDYAVLHNTSSNITITAWAGNTDISGAIVAENILLNGTIQKSVYENKTYNYINKIKDFDLLNYNIILNNKPTGTQNVPLDSDLLVAYKPNKIASLGFIFNLEKYLLANSRTFNILKQNQDYKNIILGNSKITTENSSFYKRNITKKEKDYTKILNPLEVTLTNLSGGLYYVGVVDDNKQLDNYSYYDVKVHLEIDDFSKNFLNDTILKSINNSKNFLINYKNTFVALNNDRSIDDVNVYIFENMYQEMISDINLFVNDISNVSSLFSGFESERFASLFVSCLHPLTTRLEILEKLTNYINKLESVISSINSVSFDASGLSSVAKKQNYIFDKQFGNSGADPYLADFNYDYDINHGIEVLSAEPLSARLQQTPKALPVISTEEFNSRKIFESRKYFNNPFSTTINSVNTFSISSIDFNDTSYQTLIGLPQEFPDLYNEIYLRLKEYNSFYFNYQKPETFYFQLASEGINIKTFSNRNNNSTNNLLTNTLFDPNNDTSAESLKFMTDTNIKNLYFYLDNEGFVDILNMRGTMQYGAIQPQNGGESPVFKYSEKNLNNPDLKAQTFIYYNTFYDFIPVTGTSNTDLDVYVLVERCISDLFTKKMRLFNGFFAVKKANNDPSKYAIKKFETQNDLLLNVPPSYLNRNTKSATINITTDEL